MQELQILPYDQCFAAFGGFLDSDTKQNSGSTVRKYSITNACITSTDIACIADGFFQCEFHLYGRAR